MFGYAPSPLQQGTYAPLAFPVLEAEYAPGLDRFVSVSANPPLVRVFGPTGIAELTVMLDAYPESLAVPPSGERAVVGHGDSISIIDLSTGDLTSLPFARGVVDIVDPGGAWLYVVPGVKPPPGPRPSLSNVEVATGRIVETTTSWQDAGNTNRLALAPGGDRLYVTDATTGEGAAVFDISAGPAVFMRSTRLRGGGCIPAPAYVSHAGTQLLTSCGSVYQLSDDPDLDFHYQSGLSIPNRLRAAAHAATRRHFAVSFERTNEDIAERMRTQVHVFSGAAMEWTSGATLPDYEEGGKKAALWGRMLSYSADEQAIYVIAETASSSNLPGRAAIVTLPGEPVARPAKAIDAGGPYHLLRASIIAAERSQSLDRIVMITRTPARLTLLDPATHAQRSVDLPRTPIGLVMAPSGEHAVVVYDGELAYYELGTLSLLRTLRLAERPGDTVLDDDAYVYATVPGARELFSADLRTGSSQIKPESVPPALGRYLPAEDRLVVGGVGAISFIEVGGGTLGGRVTYPGLDYDLCYRWWPGSDGRLFGSCGHVFAYGSDPRYRGSLAGFERSSTDHVFHLDQSAAAGLVASVRSELAYAPGTSREVLLHDDKYLHTRGTVRLPAFSVDGVAVAAFPRFVFVSHDGKRLDILAQADPNAALAGDSGLISVDLTRLTACPPSSPAPTPVGGSEQDAVVLAPLPFDIVDAVIDRPRARIVVASSNPPRLHLLDPAAASASASVDLPLAPTRVVLEPDGSHALVGHAGWLSRVSLDTATIADVYELSAAPHDIAIAAGRAHVIPKRDQLTRMRSIELATGVETRGALVRGGMDVWPMADELNMLTLHTATGDDDLRRLSFAAASGPPDQFGFETAGTVVAADVGGELWVTSDGQRLFGSGGGVYDLRDPQAASYPLLGRTSAEVVSLDHSSARGRIALVTRWYSHQLDGSVSQYADTGYARVALTWLPRFTIPSGSIGTHGRFVFFSNDGAQIYVLVEANSSMPLSTHFGLVRMPTAP